MADLTIKKGDTAPQLSQTIIDPTTNAAANLTGATVKFTMRALTAVRYTIREGKVIYKAK